MAPEVFMVKPYSEACDTFSFGITVWEIFARKKPFNGRGFPTQYAVLWAVSMGTRPPRLSNCPPVLEKLITKCWDQDPSQRPSMSRVEAFFERLVSLVSDVDDLTPIVFPDTANNNLKGSHERLLISEDSSDNVTEDVYIQPQQLHTEPPNQHLFQKNPKLYDFLRDRKEGDNARLFDLQANTSPPTSQVNIQPVRPVPPPPLPHRIDNNHFLGVTGAEGGDYSRGHRRSLSGSSSPPSTQNLERQDHRVQYLDNQATGGYDFYPSQSLSKPLSKSLIDNLDSPNPPDLFHRRASAVTPPSSHFRTRHSSLSRFHETSPEDDGYRTLTQNAYLSLVDPKYRPIQPDPTNEQSVKIFEEHKKYCRLYTLLKTELDLLDETAKELSQMNRNGFFSIEDEIQKQNDDLRDLIVFRDNLKTQLKKIISKKKREDAIKDGFVYVDVANE